MEAFTREISDHTPLLLDTGNASHRGNNSIFKFELSWLTQDGFYDMVARVWRKETRGRSPMQRWQNKIRSLRCFLKGWVRNQVGESRKRKSFLYARLDLLDRKYEVTLLSTQELEYKSCLTSELTKLLREEELCWLQRSKATKLLKGDDNTKYFQMLANGRHRKTRIYQLEQDEGVIIGNDNLKNYITDYYKGLFGAPEEKSFFFR